jgi:putative transcriptional regulator
VSAGDRERQQRQREDRERALAELLADHALGILSDQERREVDRLLARAPALRRERDASAEALSAAVAGALAPAPRPPRGPLDRLIATLAGPDRFAPFMADLTRLFALDQHAIRTLLARADRTAAGWETSLCGVELAETELFHFAVGPELAAAGGAGGVVRMRPGARFPSHSHGGDEVTFVLEGGYRSGSRVHGPGAVITMPGGSSHEYAAAPERPLLIIVLHRGISFG